jgi:extracellular elastinolytic metalloproteinase
MGWRRPHPGRAGVALLAIGTILVALCPGQVLAGTRLPPGPVLRARAELAAEIGAGSVVQTDPYSGALRWVTNLDGTLTGPSADAPAQITLAYVRDHRRAFGLTLADIALLVFRDDYVDVVGTHHLAWTEEVDGRTLFGAGLKSAVAADGSLVSVAGPIYHVVRPRGTARPRLGAVQAIAAARAAAGATSRRPPSVPGPRERASLVRFPSLGATRLAWDTLTVISARRIDRTVVDARTGRVLWRQNLAKAESGTGLAWPHAPGTFPNGGSVQSPVNFPVFGPTALSGNNAHVVSAADGDDTIDPGDEIEAVDPSILSWDAPVELDTATASQNCSPDVPCTWDPTTPFSWRANRTQAAVQAYYLLNAFHDHLASPTIGFTEAAGNFQVTNSDGLGGKDGDPVLAQTLVGANLAGDGRPRLLNNATMYTPPDGGRGWMSLYLFRQGPDNPAGPAADAADDASVVYHEYAHGLSSRLVTMADGSEALYGPQSAAMAEGWSDWYALDALVGEGYQADTAAVDVPMGTWITGGAGVRFQFADCRVSGDTAECPETPGGSGPGGLTYGDFGHVYTRTEPHSDGEIWLQTLWQIRDRLGSAVTQALVTRAMELSPQGPTFLDMRDAMLVADTIAFGGANHQGLWEVFAERGMGFFASALDTFDTSPRPSFVLPVTCPGPECGTLSGRVIDPGEHGSPVAGALVYIAGSQTGVPVDRYALTDADGRYRIVDVPNGRYRSVEIALGGYTTRTRHRVQVEGDSSMDVVLRRDWVALGGGATIVDFSGPDHTSPSGECGPRAAVDGSVASSWLTSSKERQFLTVRLPQPIYVLNFVVDPTALCAGAYANTAAFDIWTRAEGKTWTLAYRTERALPAHRLTRLRPIAGRAKVLWVRLVLRTPSHRNPQMEFTELMVRGSIAD